MFTDATIQDATTNPEINSAISYLSELESEQNEVVVQIVEHFVKLLPEDVDKDDWEIWWIEGWFREFCRTVSFHPLVLLYAIEAEEFCRCRAYHPRCTRGVGWSTS